MVSQQKCFTQFDEESNLNQISGRKFGIAREILIVKYHMCVLIVVVVQ